MPQEKLWNKKFHHTLTKHVTRFSSYISCVPATDSEIGAEAEDVKAVTQEICPLRIVLYRVVLTSTSFLLGCWQDESEASQRLPFFHELVARLNNWIRGPQATVSELWYVEEYDVLALALNGRMRARRYEMHCSGSGE